MCGGNGPTYKNSAIFKSETYNMCMYVAELGTDASS